MPPVHILQQDLQQQLTLLLLLLLLLLLQLLLLLLLLLLVRGVCCFPFGGSLGEALRPPVQTLNPKP